MFAEGKTIGHYSKYKQDLLQVEVRVLISLINKEPKINSPFLDVLADSHIECQKVIGKAKKRIQKNLKDLDPSDGLYLAEDSVKYASWLNDVTQNLVSFRLLIAMLSKHLKKPL